MPQKRTIQKARKAKREGKAASTQAGEFVREEMDKMKAGKGNAQSSKQAVAIGLSRARREGVALKPPAKGKASSATRKKAAQDLRAGKAKKRPVKRKVTAKKTTRRRAA
jgi:hypothetical protein